LSNLLRFLEPYSRIVVTGCQRSGTRIGAKIIAYELGLDYYDEAAIGTDSMMQLYNLITQRDDFVVQCPALCKNIEAVGKLDVAIVFMMRDTGEILASMRRIGWDKTWGVFENLLYPGDQPLPVKKYRYWLIHQRDQIDHPFSLHYADLVGHPMFYSKEERVGWTFTQTRPND